MPKYTVSTGIPEAPAGLDDEDYALVLPLYRAISLLAQQVSTLTGTAQFDATDVAGSGPFVQFQAQRMYKVRPVAAVALPYGALVNLYNNAGVLTARLADRTDGTKPAHAIVDDPLGAAVGAYANCIMLHGRSRGVSGTTVGTQYWLGLAGAMQNTKPTTAGNLAQRVAIGMGTNGIILCITGNGDVV
jgi:hypothetical protein